LGNRNIVRSKEGLVAFNPYERPAVVQVRMGLNGAPYLVRSDREAQPSRGGLYDLDVDESVDGLPIQADLLEDRGTERVPSPRAEIVQYAPIGVKELLH